MQAMIWIGAVITLAGVGALVQCGRLAFRAKTLPEAEAKGLMQRVLVLNFGGLGVAVLGLMITVAGLFLR